MTSRLPILTRQHLGADGELRLTFHVFCPPQRRSVTLDACARCARCASVDAHDGAGNAAVACESGPPPASPGEAPIGHAMARELLVVTEEARGADIVALVTPGACVLVVDDDGRLAGVGTIASPGSPGLPGATMSVSAERPRVLVEDQPLALAVRAMTEWRSRDVVVVDVDRRVVGVLRDTDVVRWYVQSKAR